MHKYYDNKDIVILWRRNRGEVQMRNYRIDICRVNMAERIDEHGCVDELSYAGLKVSKATCVKSIFLILLLLLQFDVETHFEWRAHAIESFWRLLEDAEIRGQLDIICVCNYGTLNDARRSINATIKVCCCGCC